MLRRKSIEDMRAIERTALERIHADLSSREKSLVFIFYSILFSCNSRLEMLFRAQNMTLESFISFWNASFSFIMISMDVSMC